MNIEQLKNQRYACWSGNEKGHPYDPTRCAEKCGMIGQ